MSPVVLAEDWTGPDATWVSASAFWNNPSDDGAYENPLWFSEGGTLYRRSNRGHVEHNGFFRMWTRDKTLSYARVEFDLRFNGWTGGDQSWHGINVWLNMQLRTPEPDATRISDGSKNSGYAADFMNRNGSVTISKKEDTNVYHTGASAASFTPTTGAWYRFAAEVIDNGTTTTIRLYRAPLGSALVEILSWIDDGTVGGPRLPGGRVGVRSDYANWDLDNLSISTPGGTTDLTYRDKVMAKSPSVYVPLNRLPPVDEIQFITSISAGAGVTLAPGLIAGSTDQACDFSGASGAYCSLGDFIHHAGNRKYGAEAWCRPDVVDTVERFLWSKIDGTNGWALLQKSDGIRAYRVGAGVYSVASTGSAGAMVVGSVYHVFVTYDGVTLRLYVNGALVNWLSSSLSIAQHISPLRIGANFDGVIQHAVIYPNRAPSTEEVKDNYDAGIAAAGAITTKVKRKEGGVFVDRSFKRRSSGVWVDSQP